MRIFVGLMAALLLAGCSTPSMDELRQAGPVKSYSSAKSEDAVSRCVLFAWKDTGIKGGGVDSNIQPGRSSGSTVYFGNSEIFADITSAGSGSHISYYAISDSWVSKKLRPALETCL